MAESLEAERARLDAEINRAEMAINNSRLKRDHLESLRKERERLTMELDKNQGERLRNSNRCSPSPGGSRMSRLARQNQTEELARLRAEVARDEEMIHALDQGGVCPLLTEKCSEPEAGRIARLHGSARGWMRAAMRSRIRNRL